LYTIHFSRGRRRKKRSRRRSRSSRRRRKGAGHPSLGFTYIVLVLDILFAERCPHLIWKETHDLLGWASLTEAFPYPTLRHSLLNIALAALDTLAWV
jgi:hypothetical protein